ncbi:MAG: ATP-binding protein [Clostridia bacterium]|nr:ATP-binding protein [Clostridia bacterium]
MKDLSLHLMDIIQNSITAGATRIAVVLQADGKPYRLTFEVTDNGRGMDPEFLQKVTDPFKTTRTTREVGLGIPLLKQSAEMAGGELTLHSERNKGTTLKATFDVNHIDRIPLGDIAGTIQMLIMAQPDISWNIEFSSLHDRFELDTDEVKQQLEGVPIQQSDVLEWIQNTIQEGIEAVFGGVLDEINR